MAVSGGFRRGQSLTVRKSPASSPSGGADIGSERARRRAVKRKNQRRGVFLIILMGLLVLCFLVGAWYLDMVLGGSKGHEDLSQARAVNCEFHSIKVVSFETMPDRVRQSVCQVIENRDILSVNDLLISEISLPSGFAHALDLKLQGGQAGTYRLLVDRDIILQLGSLIEAEKLLVAKELSPTLIDLRAEGRAFIK